MSRGGWLIAAMTHLALWAPAHAASQTNTAEITGVVKDVTGGVLGGALVTAIQPATGATVERVTDGQGRFYLPALRVGVWNITAALQGFSPRTQRGVILELGRTVSLEFTLPVEGLAEQIPRQMQVGVRISF